MLGLKYGTVELVPYTREWEQAFQEEMLLLRDALSTVSCQIEHIGSTAVPGLGAKPILDIGIGVSEANAIKTCIPLIEAVGYVYRGDGGSSGGHIFVRESAPEIRTHHVHLMALADPQWEAYLIFRDYLRRDMGARRSYFAAKQSLAKRFPMDRKAYTDAKNEIYQELLAEMSSR